MTDTNAQAEKVEAQIVDVTITAPDADWLRQHCGMLIEQRLAASANIIPAVDSIYRWQGEIHEATEAYAVVHTQRNCFEEIARLSRQRHPYDVVHVLMHPVEAANEEYRRWILDATAVLLD